MKNILQLIAIVLFALSMNSCYVNRTTFGDGPVDKAPAVKYSHAKQQYLFWGFKALKTAQPAMPSPGCGYQVRTSFTFLDGLVNTLTLGIFGMRTVKIMVNKDSPCDPAIIKQERKIDRELEKGQKMRQQGK